MTDIVERLREVASWPDPVIVVERTELLTEAADEIERLWAQGAHLADALYAGQQEIERLRAIEDAAIDAATYFFMGDGGEEDFDERRMIDLMKKLGRALEPKP